MLQHYVLIKYQKSATDEHIAEFCKRMLALEPAFRGSNIWKSDAIFSTTRAVGT